MDRLSPMGGSATVVDEEHFKAMGWDRIAVQEFGRVLMCDDLVVRSFMEAQAGVRGCWSQTALQRGLALGRIDADGYGEAAARPVGCRYAHI